LPRIFDRFFRVPDPEVRAERGLGLGLSFVAWIVKAHDGLIDVESEAGKGTRFVVKLPAGNPEGTENGEMAATRTAALPPGPAAKP
jgi:signal transduction histidine kinase